MSKSHAFVSAVNMRSIVASCVISFAMLGLTLSQSGCGPLVAVPSDPTKPSKPTIETVWTVLADYVDAGDVTDSTKLELIVKRLRAHGDIDDSAVEKFYAAFPGIKEKELPIDKADAAKLRGM